LGAIINDNYRYRLTNFLSPADTFPPFHKFAMWHRGNGMSGKTLDMSKDWIFQFVLHFGNGLPGKGIADGVVFAMLNMNHIGWGTRGGDHWYMGYGDSCTPVLNTSYAIEYDTEWAFYGQTDPNYSVRRCPFDEGGGLDPGIARKTEHTAFLKDGFMKAISGTYAEMQDSAFTFSSRSVRNDSFCVVVTWHRKNGINGNDGYVLSNYIQEKKGAVARRGKLIRRNKAEFSSLGNFIEGLDTTSNKFAT
jgi:hypothetical protein